MNGYERLLEVMRKQGKRDNPSIPTLGMVEDGCVYYRGQKLENDDYLIAEGIELEDGDTVLVMELSDSEYVVICKVVNS